MDGNGIDEHLQLRVFNDENTGEFKELYFHENARGDVVALTNDVGDIALSLEYSSYGVPYVVDDAGELEEFSDFESVVYGFQGRRIDQETSLMYFRNRYYNQELGRFIQRDKMGYIDGLGLYQAFSGNPYMISDPSGKWGVFSSLVGAAIGGIIGGVSGAIHGGWKGAVAGIAGGATAGAIIGGSMGTQITAGMAAGGAVTGAIGSALNGGSAADVVKSTIVGGVIGAASGAVFNPISKFVGGGIVGAVLGGEASGLVGGGLSAAVSGENIIEGMFWGMLEGAAIPLLIKGSFYGSKKIKDCVYCRKNLKTAKNSTNDFYFEDPNCPENSIKAFLGENGALDLIINAEKGSYRGGELFHKAMNHFGENVKSINGTWLYKDNLKTFNKLTAKGISEQKAALKTFTGKMAKKYGFKKSEITDVYTANGEYKSVWATFKKK